MKHNKNTQKNDSRLDRRGFLKSSSAIAGSAVALGSLSIERGAFAQSSDTIKVAAPRATSSSSPWPMPSMIAWTAASRDYKKITA
jgi:nitrous oxide reductase